MCYAILPSNNLFIAYKSTKLYEMNKAKCVIMWCRIKGLITRDFRKTKKKSLFSHKVHYSSVMGV